MNNEIKEICRKCEENIHCQGKGCAFRSLGNEYCDKVDNANKLINDLQKQNTELKERINTYENPEDLTLMFMYCDEKAKDKIKELKDNWNKLKDYIVKEYYIHLPLESSTTSIIILINKMQELEQGSE